MDIALIRVFYLVRVNCVILIRVFPLIVYHVYPPYYIYLHYSKMYVPCITCL